MVNRYMTSQGTQVSMQDTSKMSAMSPQSIASICKYYYYLITKSTALKLTCWLIDKSYSQLRLSNLFTGYKTQQN